MMDSQNLTMTGTLIGSPAYMAPEVIDGQKITEQSDIFAVGILLYKMTTGCLPFAGQSPAALLKKIATGDYVSPQQKNPHIHTAIQAIIEECLAHNPDKRFRSAEDLEAKIHENLNSYGFVLDRDLKHLLLAPETMQQSWHDVLTNYYSESAKRAVSNKNKKQAYDAIDRVLTLRPGDTDILKLLKQLQKKDRVHKSIVGTFVVVICLSALFLGFISITKMLQVNPQDTKNTSSIVNEGDPVLQSVPNENQELPKTDKEQPVAQKSKLHKTVEMHASPAWVNVWHNQKLIATNKMGRFFLELPEGKHQLIFKNPLAEDYTTEVTIHPQKSTPPLFIHLTPLPARLKLDKVREDVVVEIQGQRKLVSLETANEPIFVKIPIGHPKIELDVLIHNNKRQTVVKQKLEFKPGQEITLKLPDL